MQRISSPMPRAATGPGGPNLRREIRAHERTLSEAERKQLDGARSPEERAALKTGFTKARAERARRYAAMLCSEPGWAPKPRSSSEGKILTSFYGLLGQRAREEAARTGKPFSMAHVEQVRLSKADVEALRKQFGDAEVKKAWPLLKKHIAHEGFLDQAALRFMTSAEFLTFQAALTSARDKVERALDAHEEQLSAKDAEALREHIKLGEKRRLTSWDQPVVVEREQNPDGSRDKVTYVSVGGRLVPVDRDGEQ